MIFTYRRSTLNSAYGIIYLNGRAWRTCAHANHEQRLAELRNNNS